MKVFAMSVLLVVGLPMVSLAKEKNNTQSTNQNVANSELQIILKNSSAHKKTCVPPHATNLLPGELYKSVAQNADSKKAAYWQEDGRQVAAKCLNQDSKAVQVMGFDSTGTQVLVRMQNDAKGTECPAQVYGFMPVAESKAWKMEKSVRNIANAQPDICEDASGVSSSQVASRSVRAEASGGK